MKNLLLSSTIAICLMGGFAYPATADDMSKMSGMNMAGSSSNSLKSVLHNYLIIQSALANDSLTRVPTAASAIDKAAVANGGRILPSNLGDEAKAIAKAKNLDSAREAFKPLSDSIIKLLKDSASKTGMYNEAYCPMASASWIQTGKSVSNPYYGKKMSRCGEIKATY